MMRSGFISKITLFILAMFILKISVADPMREENKRKRNVASIKISE